MVDGFIKIRVEYVFPVFFLCVLSNPAYCQSFPYASYGANSGTLAKTGKLDYPEPSNQVLFGSINEEEHIKTEKKPEAAQPPERPVYRSVNKRPKRVAKKQKWKVVKRQRFYTPARKKTRRSNLKLASASTNSSSIPGNYYHKPKRNPNLVKEMKEKEAQLRFERKERRRLAEEAEQAWLKKKRYAYGGNFSGGANNANLSGSTSASNSNQQSFNEASAILSSIGVQTTTLTSDVSSNIKTIQVNSRGKFGGPTGIISKEKADSYKNPVTNEIVLLGVGKNDYRIDGDTLTYDASPLMLDINHDGTVSAKAGTGIDIDGDNIADGTAITGDKVLVMTDLNGNNKIDGAEVFGNFTIDPVSKKPLNVRNGFEALITIAKNLKAATGIDCYTEESLIDLYKLREALLKATNNSITLGYISEDKVTELEPLESVDATGIHIDYSENSYNSKDTVQHRQVSYYVTKDGSKYKIDDIWFRNDFQ